ncbi:MAG: NlpC/P60 family protein [Clostridium sp.]|uniref:C40 family peptidase n=1 Tax=Clostridium sp. TaxID=1506 RepID=UPI00267169A8|nr:C40 family peptidase [Clostridium sp.]MDD7682320.1 NlpC/P60 family protein [Clostridium sp.]MDY2579940.1 NlpC/P60 family protein [Clostridium sp.]
MKKKVLSALLTATLLFSIGMPAFATPNEEVIENQAKYDELTAKIDEITGQVYALNAEIEPLMETIENNKAEVEEIKIEVENTEKEIETTKADIEKSEEVLGKRIREFYKSGGQVNYLTLLFSAESFNDLISKIDSTTRIVNIDKELIAELEEKKANLNEKVTVLEERKAEVIKLTEESEAALDELNAKKAEQEIAIEQLNAEQEEFEKNYLSVSERKLVAHQQSVLETSNDKNELQAAIDQLTSIRDNQIKSEIVKQEISDSIYYGTIKLEEIIEAEEAKEAEEAAKAAAQQQISSPNRGEITSGTASSASGNAIVSYAYNFIGTPYVYGATGPDAFDCSGFTSYVYANAAGINITRTTYSQMGVGTPVSYDQLQPGDLVFTYGGDHVGIYVGGGQYIHAPQPGDSVKVGNITSFYCARRVL